MTGLILPDHYRGGKPGLILPGKVDQFLDEQEAFDRVRRAGQVPPGMFGKPPSAASAPTVVTRTRGTVGGAGTVSLNLPASIVAGNLLLVAAGWAGSGTDTSGAGTLSDWTLLDYVNPGTTIAYRRMKVWYTTATGSEGATVDLNFSATSAVAYSSFQISGVTNIYHATENSVNVGSTSTTPDPPNLSIGSLAPTLWLALCTKRQSTNMTSGPSGYSNFQTSSTTNMMGATAEFTSTASSENPGVFTGSTSDHWTCFTVGLR